MKDDELTRQDEDISAPEFGVEEAKDLHDFGNLPELIGLVFTIGIIWMLFATAG